MNKAETKLTISLHLDRFQQMKRDRMRCLLEELERVKAMKIKDFLSHISINYGIRRATGEEYIRDWVDAGCVIVEGDTLKFVTKPSEWK